MVSGVLEEVKSAGAFTQALQSNPGLVSPRLILQQGGAMSLDRSNAGPDDENDHLAPVVVTRWHVRVPACFQIELNDRNGPNDWQCMIYCPSRRSQRNMCFGDDRSSATFGHHGASHAST